MSRAEFAEAPSTHPASHKAVQPIRRPQHSHGAMEAATPATEATNETWPLRGTHHPTARATHAQAPATTCVTGACRVTLNAASMAPGGPAWVQAMCQSQDFSFFL